MIFETFKPAVSLLFYFLRVYLCKYLKNKLTINNIFKTNRLEALFLYCHSNNDDPADFVSVYLIAEINHFGRISVEIEF